MGSDSAIVMDIGITSFWDVGYVPTSEWNMMQVGPSARISLWLMQTEGFMDCSEFTYLMCSWSACKRRESEESVVTWQYDYKRGLVHACMLTYFANQYHTLVLSIRYSLH
jgi:hypothetical protein